MSLVFYKWWSNIQGFSSAVVFHEFIFEISASNHMFGRAIFENFEIARVRRVQFQKFQKSRGWFIPKMARTKYVITV